MAQVIHKIEDLNDLIHRLTDLTELIDAADDALREIRYDGLGRDQSGYLDKGMALVRIAREMSIQAMEGAEAAHRNGRASEK